MTARVDRCDMIAVQDCEASTDSSENDEPTENADANEPIEPTDSADPTEPTDSTEFRDPIDSNESRDHSDHFDDVRAAFIGTILRRPGPPAGPRCRPGGLSSRTPRL